MAEPFYVPTSDTQGLQVFHILADTYTQFFFVCLIMALLVSIKWYNILDFIFITVMINNVKQLFMCLFAIHISSSEAVYLSIFPIFNWVVYFVMDMCFF